MCSVCVVLNHVGGSFRHQREPAFSLDTHTFSVRVTLRRLRVEKPEEHSVSVGELGQEWVSNLCCCCS